MSTNELDLPTTVEGALALVANAVPSEEYVDNGGDLAFYAAILDEIARGRPVDRADFSKSSFWTVLNADGSANVVHVRERYNGIPRFVYSGDNHAEDSFWAYLEVDFDFTPGPDPLSTVSQADWFRASGRTAIPFWPKRINAADKRRIEAGPPRKEARSKVKTNAGRKTA